MMKIGVDLISGESPVEELIEGCVEAAVAAKDIEIVMIGRGDVYRPLLEQKKYLLPILTNRLKLVFLNFS